MEFPKFLNRGFKRLFSLDSDIQNSPENGDIELNAIPYRGDVQETLTHDEVIGDFQIVEDFIEFFQSPEISREISRTDALLILKLGIEDTFNGFNHNELRELKEMCLEKSIIILLATPEHDKLFLYWKSRHINHFWKLNIKDSFNFMLNMDFMEFVIVFLMLSLKRGHLGHSLVPKHEASLHECDFERLQDRRGYNLMLIAAEIGNYNVVNLLQRTTIETECMNMNPQTLAYTNQHFDILELLLMSNFTYPTNFDINVCPENIKELLNTQKELRDAILSADEDKDEKIREIRNKFPDLRHFYDMANESVASFALKNNLLHIYSMLLAINVIHGPGENVDAIKKRLSKKDIKKLKEIQYENTGFLPNSHTLSLISNTRTFGLDNNEGYNLIKEIFTILDENPLIKIILQIVAASRKIFIILDFKSDSTGLIDPTSDSTDKGIFYITGRIYIGAKDLLNVEKRYEVLGTIAHELCHYAMYLVYENFAKPYKKIEAEKEFEDVSRYCEGNQVLEKLIQAVYSLYSASFQHAELIVRVPHIIAHYIQDAVKFELVRRDFWPLFDFYESKVVPEMEEALPIIRKKAEKGDKRNLKYQIITVIVFIILGIIAGAIITKYNMKDPNRNFDALTEEEQFKVRNASVRYMGEIVSMDYLFPFANNSDVYRELKSDDIYKILDDDLLDLSEPHLEHLGKRITLSWNTLAKNLKNKVKNAEFIIQNRKIKMSEFIDKNQDIIENLTSDQLKLILSTNEFSIQSNANKDIRGNTFGRSY